MTRSLALAVAAVVATAVPVLASTTASYTAAVRTTPPASNPVTLRDGLQYTDVIVGKGDVVKAGQTIEVDYVGSFPNGTVFDTSQQHGGHFTFPVGAHQVIRCWDEGVVGMRVGGTRKLVCPPDLAYGARGAANVIPPNATLDFTIHVVPPPKK
jgi:FKBP-type peptidyl-prolyl cis-trans isomerase